MKTTVELPDELYRRAKAEAALRGRKFRELVEEGLTRVLDQPEGKKNNLRLVLKRARGIVDSGVPDLATNPKHFAGFGRNARNR